MKGFEFEKNKQATASYVGVGHTKLNDSNSNQD